jgi:hypothetical protein
MTEQKEQDLTTTPTRSRMAGGDVRRGTLVVHYVTAQQRPLLDRGSPETQPGPAVTNPRIRV